MNNKDYRLSDEKIKHIWEKGGWSVGFEFPLLYSHTLLDAQIADLLKEVPVEKLKEELLKDLEFNCNHCGYFKTCKHIPNHPDKYCRKQNEYANNIIPKSNVSPCF